MKVTIYSETGECLGIAWHENSLGVVDFPPATRDIFVTHFTVNDGPKLELMTPTLMPVDAPLTLAVFINGRGKEVDKEATMMRWWRRAKEAFTWTW